jgi:predicted transcriptional regulator YdeE
MSDGSLRDLTSFEQRHRAHFATRDGFWLTGLVSTGPYADANERISGLWDELVLRQDEMEIPSEWLSLCHGRETEFSCYLGLGSVERPSIVPKGMVTVEVPTHEYAVARVSGSQDDVNAVYTYLPAWSGAHGREWNRSILWIEVYPEPYRHGTTELKFEIWLPLVEQEARRQDQHAIG